MTFQAQSPRRKGLFLALYVPEFPAQAVSAFMPGYESIPFVVVEQKNTRYKSRVAGCSFPALDRQIETGWMLSDLTEKQKKALLILPRNKGYESRILDDLSVLVERYTPEYRVDNDGECILNLAGTPALKKCHPGDLAERIKREIGERTGVREALAGISRMRTLARVLARRSIGEVRACPDSEEIDWLMQADLFDFPDIPTDLVKKLSDQGFRSLAHIHRLDRRDIMKRFGKELGEWLYMLTLGYDLRYHPREKVTYEFQKVLVEDINNDLLLREHLLEAADRVLSELQAAGQYARSLRIVLDYSDGRRAEGAFPVDPPSDLLEQVSGPLYRCFVKLYTRRVALQVITITCRQFTKPGSLTQGSLFTDSSLESSGCKAAISKIRADFGFEALSKGSYFRVSSNAKRQSSDPACSP